MIENLRGLEVENSVENIEESFEELLSGKIIDVDGIEGIETEPLCGSCFAPLDVDEYQTIGYCEKCQTTVFVERRIL